MFLLLLSSSTFLINSIWISLHKWKEKPCLLTFHSISQTGSNLGRYQTKWVVLLLLILFTQTFKNLVKSWLWWQLCIHVAGAAKGGRKSQSKRAATACWDCPSPQWPASCWWRLSGSRLFPMSADQQQVAVTSRTVCVNHQQMTF